MLGKTDESNPTEFNDFELNFQNMVDSKWSKFTLTVEHMDEATFLASLKDKTKEFIVGVNGHMLYVEKVEDNGKTLVCLNSHGEDDTVQNSLANLRLTPARPGKI